MSGLQICRICLRTEAKMYKYDQFHLKFYYEEVMALKVNENDGLPQCFCYMCAAVLHKFHKFKEKCYSGQKVLREMLWRGAITYEGVYKVDRRSNNLQLPVDIMTINNCVKTYFIKDKTNSTFPIEYDMPHEQNIHYHNHYSTDNKDDIVINSMCDIDQEMVDIDKQQVTLHRKEPPSSPKIVFVDIKKEIVMLKSEEIKEKCVKEFESQRRKMKNNVDLRNWRKYVLSEEEALKEFRAGVDDKQYLKAAYKCTDCFKGFSKKNMLDRHIQFRHVESIGPFECRFCRMRFKWKFQLARHIRRHYTKYECLRCDLKCVLENTVFLHEEYHSGVTRKCVHCGQEFRHSSTYYTHLRTHRSSHVCALCGASFVSALGLHNHKKVKHVINDIESPDDDEEVNTYCEKCNIRFETRKAYEEHLFHSALHSEGDDIATISTEVFAERNKKVLSKTEKKKVINTLRRREISDELSKQPEEKRRRRTRKKVRRKPTTCYQCGEHFETQAACMKHHQTEHPRTSFCPPAHRHICEICGASLAPGSVAMHANIHSRAALHACSVCGKQFHSPVGLKRHLVTHTGEKRFGCPLCDKRFTQSNSMKLHYRTFHLKQPYPKRNRRKKKDEPQKEVEAEVSSSEEETDTSLPEPDIELVPAVRAAPAPDDMPPTHEDMHYLRL